MSAVTGFPNEVNEFFINSYKILLNPRLKIKVIVVYYILIGKTKAKAFMDNYPLLTHLKEACKVSDKDCTRLIPLVEPLKVKTYILNQFKNGKSYTGCLQPDQQ